MRKLIAAVAVVFLALLGLAFTADAAAAHEGDTDCTTETTGWVTKAPSGKDWTQTDERTVVDEEAWTEENVISEAVPGQHYSYTGGPVEGQPLPPSEDPDSWQANTQQEPPGHANSATWVDGGSFELGGLHYTSHGSSGLADWFFYQAPVDAVIEIIEHEAVTHQEYKFERETCVTTPHEHEPKPDNPDKPEPPADQPPKADKPELPHTGGETAILALLGSLLLGSGGLLLKLSR